MRITNKLLKRMLISAVGFGALGITCLFVNPLTAKAASTDITFTEGASVKIDNPSGIQFQGVLNTTAASAVFVEDTTTLKENAEVGMIVVPAQALENINDDYFVELKKQFGKEKNQISDYVTTFTPDGNTYKYECSIVNILPENYTYEYQAVAYYTTDGTNYVYSEKSSVRNVLQVADTALNLGIYDGEDKKELKATLVSMVENYLKKANADYAVSFAKGENVTLADEIVGLGQIEGATFSVKEGQNTAVASVADGVVSSNGIGGGETVLTMSAYGGDLTIEIPVTVTDVQTVETDIPTGFANFTSVATATKGDVEITVSGGKIALEHTNLNNSNGGKEETYLLTHTDGTTTTLNATVWSLIIDDETELRSINSYGYIDSNAFYGYYKLNKNIELSQNWTNQVYIAKDAGSFKGVFEGNGKTIDKINIANTETGFVKILAAGGVVRNVTFTNAQVSAGGKNAIVVGYFKGGTIENVTVEITANAAHATYWECGLAGAINRTTADMAVTNVTVIWKGATATTGTGKHYALFARYEGAKDSVTALALTNVTVIGFNDCVYADGDNGTNPTCKTEADAETIWDSEITCYKDYATYVAENTTVLTAIATDLDAAENYTRTVNFADYMPQGKTIASVTDNGTPVATQVTYEKEDASDIARKIMITDTDGKLYSLELTVWSKIIKSADDLLAAENYGYYTQLSGEATNRRYYGYFTLSNDVQMGEKTWGTNNAIARSSANGSTAGFLGVFDGAGHTIYDFNVVNSDIGLFKFMGQDGIVRNLTFEDAKITVGNRNAIITFASCGGTIENVVVKISELSTTASNACGLVADPNTARASGCVMIKNTTVIWKGETAYTGDRGHAALFSYEASGKQSTITMSNVTVVGFTSCVYAERTSSTAIGTVVASSTIESSTPSTWTGMTYYDTYEAWQTAQQSAQ